VLDGELWEGLREGRSRDVEDFLRVGSAPRQDEGRKDRADGGQGTNTHLGRYDHPRHRGAEAGLATLRAIVVGNAAGAASAQHGGRDNGDLGEKKPEREDEQ